MVGSEQVSKLRRLQRRNTAEGAGAYRTPGAAPVARSGRAPYIGLMTLRLVLLLLAPIVVGCTSRPAPPPLTPQDAFWGSLSAYCGQAFAGRLTDGNESDSVMRRSTLVMHVRSCSDSIIRVPFHVGADRSRTWVFTRTSEGLRLKHDHRHEDGSEDAVTQYGGDTRDAGTETRQEFPADAHTATVVPAARANTWTVEIVPGERFVYALRREGTDRRVRVEFDLAAPVALPPDPWGAAPPR